MTFILLLYVIDAGFSAIGSYTWLESRVDGLTVSECQKAGVFFAEFK